MNDKKKQKIESDMADVIATSRRMREFLDDESVPLEEKKEMLKIVNTKLKLNNNIVSATIVTVQIEKLPDEN